MKKLLTLFMLSVLLLGALSTSATYSDELDDEEYTWELTVFDVPEPGNVEEGDEFTMIFNEAPAGNTPSDYTEGDVTLEYNGDEYDFTENFEDWTYVDQVFFVIAILFAIEDPADTWDENPDIEIVDGQAILESDDSKTAWNEESGLLELYEFDDGTEAVTIELKGGFFSFLPISPVFFIFTLLAIPLLRKFKN